ncbi:hypothetical protein [Catenuloplanes atrovinosus]|uniref:Uncharacterized protein n=1 Tax=Catenuloplanes atrovinosus TaxID=137266 RepID=A0AAE3YNS4_9ACTN|nr:hypothetical protein [Catenuloplanes atrovinosus]MDR7275136.1 hypothetical protein [Catenuloplanes atrovinosus]
MIADGLVLTAEHHPGRLDDTVEVEDYPDHPRSTPGRLIWSDPVMEVALVEVPAAAGETRLPPARFGRILSSGTELDVVALALTTADTGAEIPEQRTPPERESIRPVGTARPRGHEPRPAWAGPTRQTRIVTGPPDPISALRALEALQPPDDEPEAPADEDDEEEPAEQAVMIHGRVRVSDGLYQLELDADRLPPGLAGAPVFARGLLLGVITDDAYRPGRRSLTLTPVWRLLRDRTFSRPVGRFAKRPAVSEPVELAHALVDPYAGPDRIVARAAEGPYPPLLTAEAAVVPFRGRVREIRELTAWCNAEDRTVHMLMHAPSGEGKTRLAAELLTRLRAQGWLGGVAGDLRRLIAGLDAVDGPTAPTLIIVDDAETRPPALLAEVLDRLAMGRRARIRALMLAKSAGSWMLGLSDRTRLAGIRTLALGPLYPDPAMRAAEQRRAARAFAEIFDRGMPGRPYTAVVEQSPRPMTEGLPAFGHALTLQAAALLWAIGRPLPDAGRYYHDPLAALLRHEDRYLNKVADRHRIAPNRQARTRLVAVATLFGATTEDEARTLLGGHNGTGDVDAWLSDLYPAERGGHWRPVRPALVAEELVVRALLQNGAALRTADLALFVPRATHHQRVRMLTLLTGASARHPALAGVLRDLVRRHPDALAPAVPDVRVRVPDPSPLLRAFADVGPTVAAPTPAATATLTPPVPDRLYAYVASANSRGLTWWRILCEVDAPYLRIKATTEAPGGGVPLVIGSIAWLGGATGRHTVRPAPHPDEWHVIEMPAPTEAVLGSVSVVGDRNFPTPAMLLVSPEPLTIPPVPVGRVTESANAQLGRALSALPLSRPPSADPPDPFYR